MSFKRSTPFTIQIILPVCLLLFIFSGELLAAAGSTRLTIRIDQGVVDAVLAWREANGLPPTPSSVGAAGQTRPPAASATEADRVLQRMLPVLRSGLRMSLNPQAADRIIHHLQQDALVVFEGRAEHSGSLGGTCVTEQVAGRLLTAHSI